jgi:hypothetical protein
MEPTTIAIDLAKRVFQIHYVEPETGAIHSKVLKRAQLVPFFANRPASSVVMEACGSAHHWARVLTRLGHDVRLIAAQFVRPFVKSNKNDAADAAAIWEAAQRPGMRFVAVKTEDQQAMLAMHRIGCLPTHRKLFHRLGNRTSPGDDERGDFATAVGLIKCINDVCFSTEAGNPIRSVSISRASA